MSAEPYLILHKVRGQPAFDIAIPLQIGDEEGWIIPTSGHRAYPLHGWPVADLPTALMQTLHSNYPDWDSWPDHYEVLRSPPTQETTDLLASLGLLNEKPIARRKL